MAKLAKMLAADARRRARAAAKVAAQAAALATALAAALSGVSLLAGCHSRDTRVSTYLQLGQQYLADGNLRRAQDEFADAMQAAPYSGAARYLSGRVAELLGQSREADDLYLSAIEIAPGLLPAYESLARSYIAAGDPGRAVELLGPELLQHPDDPDLLAARGMARAALHDADGALADAMRALKIAPQNENATILRASLLEQDGRAPGAETLLAAALKRSPASISLRIALADVYAKLGKPDPAAAQLASIVALQPRQFAYRNRLSELYAHAGRLDDAERVLKEAMAAGLNGEAPGLAYVEFLSRYRSAVQARRVLDQLLAGSPADDDLLLERAELQRREGNLQGALQDYAQVVASGARPEALAARKRIAALLAERGELAAAAARVQQVLQIDPHDDQALLLGAQIDLARYDPGAALTGLNAVLTDQPGSARALQLLGRARLANGDTAGAVQALRSALDTAPDDVVSSLELAGILAQTNDVPAAIELLQQAVKTAPGDLAVRAALVQACIEAPDFAAARRAVGDLRALALQVPADHATALQAMAAYLDGLVAQAQRQYARAERDYRQALRSDPAAMPALTALSRVEVISGHASRALADVAAVVQAQPANATAHNLLGELYLAGKAYPVATEQLQRAMLLAPSWWEPYRNLALTQAAAGNVPGAIGTLERGIQAAGPQPALVTQLGALYESQGRTDDAIHLYEAYHRRAPGSVRVAAALAALLVTYRSDRASLDEAQDLTAAFAASEDGRLIDTAGWVHLKLGEVPEALSELRRALQILPTANEVHYHLGMAELAAGHRERARAELQTALEGTGSFVGIKAARATLATIRAAGSPHPHRPAQ